MIASTYFAYTSWQKYQKNTSLKSQLNNTKLLQSVEHSVLNEIVCVATMSQHKALMEKVCKPTKKTTDNVLKQILAQDDSALYELEKIIFNIRTSIENSGTVAVEKLVNGELDKEMHAFIQKYTQKLKNYSNDMDKKEYLRFYADISNISYETESEKALVSYYLTLKKPIPSENLIYWDKTVSKSEIYNLSSNKISILHEDIDSMWKQDTFQSTLRGMEDIRLDIMSHSSLGNYKSNVATWVALLNKKQKVLLHVESMLLGHILDDVSEELEKSFLTLLLSILALILALVGILIFIEHWRKEAVKKKLFDDLLTKVSSEHSESGKIKLNDDIKSYKIAYDYIDSSYESMSVKGKSVDTENKVNTAFLNNLAYEIRTPLNGISGYTKLLKETSLNVEQSDFVSLIENSFENLDSILNKISNDTVLTSQKLEVENYSFDIVKKVESAVETFAIKSDQKDIVLGLYIDPTLPQKIKGDATKLSQIMTNLIDNALESSSAYNKIDITLEKIHSDLDQISVKFSIVDEGIGYNEDEVRKITDAFETIETIDNIAAINMKNLSISNKIIKRMGGKLELESRKGEGSNFFFTLSFENDSNQLDTAVYPTFEGMKIGLALPSKDINRQIDKNLEMYINHLGAEYTIYDYETLFDSDIDVALPDLMCVYHNYIRLEGELAAFSNLDCKVALITSGTLRSRIDTDKYSFSSIIYAPMTMRKIIKIIAESRIDKELLIEEVVEKKDEVRKFDNIRALIVEDNDISKKIISNILEKFDVHVTTASDGMKAFELRRESDFDIIFMDIEMPVMDGIEATSKILYYEGVNQFQHVPIIALTADATVASKEKYAKAGMDDCIEKPIDADTIYNMVNKYAVERQKELAQSEEDELIAKVLAGDFLKE
jgi:signal transduction histidine kinase/FixJ family two-component response regulator